MSAAFAAGLETVDDPVREATVTPGIARALLARVTPASRNNVAKALASALGRALVLPPVESDGKRQAPFGQEAKVNTLLSAVPAGARRTPQSQLSETR